MFGKLKEAASVWWDENALFAYVSDPLVHPETDDVVTLDVPGYRQVQRFTCGYVAGMMVLHTFKPRASEDRFYERCAPDPDEGVPVARLARALRDSGIKVGLRSSFAFDDIRRAIDSGRPVILTVGAGGEHWVVVYGYGEAPRRVFIAGNGLPHLSKGKQMTWEAFVRKHGGEDGGLVCWAA